MDYFLLRVEKIEKLMNSMAVEQLKERELSNHDRTEAILNYQDSELKFNKQVIQQLEQDQNDLRQKVERFEAIMQNNGLLANKSERYAIVPYQGIITN